MTTLTAPAARQSHQRVTTQKQSSIKTSTKKSSRGACVRWLPGSNRLHLQHGPIDVLLEASGSPEDVAAAYRQATQTFNELLNSLVAELAFLRTPIEPATVAPNGRVARRMVTAAKLYQGQFITPMAAVAGAVADELLDSMCYNTSLTRAHVNNGGDIALFLSPSAQFTIGICADERTGEHGTRFDLAAKHGVGGIATSGWRGRSHSLGVADSVTVLASSAAIADTAATLIANEVNLPHSTKVERLAAHLLSPDTDLGDRLVTTAVHNLNNQEKQQALQLGVCFAQDAVNKGIIHSCYLHLQGKHRVVTAGHDRLERRSITSSNANNIEEKL